jgi:hypothetical protein
MADSLSVTQLNRDVADKTNEETLKDPSSPLAGKSVGIIDGRVVAVADELREVMRQPRASGVDPRRMFCFEAGRDYSSGRQFSRKAISSRVSPSASGARWSSMTCRRSRSELSRASS